MWCVGGHRRPEVARKATSSTYRLMLKGGRLPLRGSSAPRTTTGSGTFAGATKALLPWCDTGCDIIIISIMYMYVNINMLPGQIWYVVLSGEYSPIFAHAASKLPNARPCWCSALPVWRSLPVNPRCGTRHVHYDDATGYCPPVTAKTKTCTHFKMKAWLNKPFTSTRRISLHHFPSTAPFPLRG